MKQRQYRSLRRLSHVESLSPNWAVDACDLPEAPPLVSEKAQHSTGQDTRVQPSRDGDRRLSHLGCEADTKAPADPFEGCEDLLEAGIEEWNIDFAVARARLLATQADEDRLCGKDDDAVYSGPDTDAETVMAGCMSISSSFSRDITWRSSSVPSLSLSGEQSSEMPPQFCKSILGTSLRTVDDGTHSPWLGTHLPTSSLVPVRSFTTGQCETKPQMQSATSHVALKSQQWSAGRVQVH